MELTRSVTPGALILESTFSSLYDRIPFLAPVARLVFGDVWNSAEAASVRQPPSAASINTHIKITVSFFMMIPPLFCNINSSIAFAG